MEWLEASLANAMPPFLAVNAWSQSSLHTEKEPSKQQLPKQMHTTEGTTRECSENTDSASACGDEQAL